MIACWLRRAGLVCSPVQSSITVPGSAASGDGGDNRRTGRGVVVDKQEIFLAVSFVISPTAITF